MAWVFRDLGAVTGMILDIDHYECGVDFSSFREEWAESVPEVRLKPDPQEEPEAAQIRTPRAGSCANLRNRPHFSPPSHLPEKNSGYSAVIDPPISSHDAHIFITAPVTKRSHNFACTADNEPAFVGVGLRT